MFTETREKIKAKLAIVKAKSKEHGRVVSILIIALAATAGSASASDNSSVNFTKIIDLMEEMPAVIAPIADIIAEMIVIMAYLAVAGLIIGIFAGIVSWINKSFGGFNFK